MRKAIEQTKATYLAGMRVRLIKMDDIQASPIGTEGTVKGVDDIGSVMVAWEARGLMWFWARMRLRW